MSVIDLRPGRAKAPPSGQQRLFSPRSEKPRAAREQPPRRPMPLRAKRRRMRALIAFIVLLFLGGVAYGVHYVSYLPQFSVDSISIVGASDVPPQLIHDYAESILNDGSYHFLSRGDIFVYPRTVIERDVVAFFPRISSASVSRASLLSTAITITVQERQQFALWCLPAQAGTDDSQSDCYSMDSGGFIFAQATSTSASSTSQYVFEGGLPAQAGVATSSASGGASTQPIGQSFVPAHLPGIVALLTELGQSGFTPRGATIDTDEDFSVSLAQGFFLKASFGEDADMLTKNLQLVLSSDALQGQESQLEYVDLRFGDRVYYKLQGQAEATSTAQ